MSDFSIYYTKDAGGDGPNNPTLEESDEALPVMDWREWPVYAVLMKHGDLYWYDTTWGNRYNTGDGWLMVLPWGEPRKSGGFNRGDNRFGVEHEDVAAFTLLNPAPSAEIGKEGA